MEKKEAMKILKDFYDKSALFSIRTALDTVIPELKESDDDRIRKALICGMYALKEQHKTCFASIPIDNAIAWLEKQGKQKPVDKVEPKFKVGDWITDGYLYNKITDVLEDRYIVDTKFAKRSSIPFKFENYYHLWTIQDAKDGDVLADKYNNIGIFQECEGICWHSYIYLGCYGELRGFNNIGGMHEQTDAHPATQEQRDLLFQNIKEAGYEFDFEQKELKEIELTKSESEEELSDFEAALFSAFSDGWQQYLHGEEVDFAQWAKEHSAELLEAANQNHVAWSEEDESLRLRTIGALETCKIGSPTKCVDEQINWLKSLRPQNWTKEDKERYISCLQRLSTGNPEQPETINSKWFKKHVYPQSHWKPTDLQLECLSDAIISYNRKGYPASVLKELLDQLKKLKE